MARSLCCYVNLQTYFIYFAGYPRVLMQAYEDKITLLIADDATPDSTQDKVEELLANITLKHRIEYHQHPQNLRLAANFVRATLNAKGKYIGFFEGDDNCTPPTKIKQQVVYFEGRPSASGCFHHAQLVDESGKQLEAIYKEKHIGSSTQFNQRKAFTFC